VVPVVGIGASAGGLEALSTLLSGLPAHTGLAFVLVQHLEPSHASNLAEILSRQTPMPVTQVEEGMPVEADHVYVIPPDTQMRVRGGVFALSPRPGGRTPSLTIDVFMESLAREYGNRAIGVVLSGAASDGVRGLAAIRAANGIGLVQDPATAAFPSMPQSSIDAGVADLVLDVPGIAAEIGRLALHPYLREKATSKTVGKDGERQVDDLDAIFARLREVSGLDLTNYKRPTMVRRLGRRMAMRHVDTRADYLRLLEADPDEAALLLRDVLVRVTSFFRDPAAFETLKTEVFPRIIGDPLVTRPVRVWVAGCATGQEAYSIVMVLVEYLESIGSSRSIQVFASDLREDDLVLARHDFYPAGIENEVTPERLARFFSPAGTGYEVCKSVREACVFARHDMTADPPFAHLDLISCRNVLIYMDTALQRRVLSIFHYALLDEGILFLGPSEGVTSAPKLFGRAKSKSMFVRNKHESPVPILGRRGPSHRAAGGSVEAGRNPRPADAPTVGPQGSVDELLLERYSPAAIVVDGDLRVLQLRGDAGDYLRPRAGVASLDLRSMASEGLSTAVESAVEECTRTQAPARRARLHLKTEKGSTAKDLVVVPIDPGCEQPTFLIMLEQADARNGDAGGSPGHPDEIPFLRQELEATRERLKARDRRNEAANEEFRAASEEIQSSNEELQSVNEELETAKEELQSANEELTTLNDELQSRNRELGANNDDLGNLLTSVDIPIVMLDRDLGIRRYTAQAAEIFHLIPGDVGRPFADIRSRLRISDFEKILRDVLARDEPVEREVADEKGIWYQLVVRPYQTAAGETTGVVVTLQDVNALRTYQAELETMWRNSEAINRIALAFQESTDPGTAGRTLLGEAVAALGADRALWLDYENNEWCLRIEFPRPRGRGAVLAPHAPYSSAEAKRLGLRHYKTGEVLLENTGGLSARGGPGDTATGSLLTLPVLALDGKLAGAVRFTFSGEPRTFSSAELDFCRKLAVVVTLIFERANRDRLTAALVEERTASLATTVVQLAEAVHIKDIFLANMSHELRTPLNSIIGFSGVLLGGLAGELSEEQRRQIQMIRTSGDRLLATISDILDLEKIEAGAMPVEPTEFVAADIVRGVVDLFEPLARAKHLELTCEPPNRRIVLRTDEAKLRAILVNLLSNAIRYTDSGTVAASAESTRTTFTVTIRDTGYGMTPEQTAQAFDAFQQFAKEGHVKPGGTGLGLSIAKHLAEMLGGHVDVESEPGKGSTFKVTIKRRIAPPRK